MDVSTTSSQRSHRLQSGVTLIELLITLVLVSIMATIAVPSYSSLTQSSQLTTHANNLLQSLVYTRSESVRRSIQVTMCKSTNGSSCATGNSAFWHQGWLVFEDTDTDGVFDASSDEILKIQQALPSNLTLYTGNNVSDWIAYQADGGVRGSGGGGTDTFRLCDSRKDPNNARSIIISNTGRARVSEGTASCP